MIIEPARGRDIEAVLYHPDILDAISEDDRESRVNVLSGVTVKKSFKWERTFDADLINFYIADDPAFFRVKTPELFPQVIFLHCEGVGIFPGIIRDDEFHVHACVTPHSRGRTAVYAVKDGIKWVFDHLPVDRITTKADRTKRHLLMFNAMCFRRTHADNKYVYYEVRK